MSRYVRIAVTETANVYPHMPTSLDDVEQLAERLDDMRQANLDHHAELIAAAAERGARAVGLGELFPAPYFALHRHPLWIGLAESLRDGPSVTFMQAVARRHQVVIVAPFYERDGDKRFNTAAVIDADGSLLGCYRKSHIPEGSNEVASFHETFYYQRSDGHGWAGKRCGDNRFFPVFETAAGRVGVSICYDRHFGGVVASLAQGGAQIVFNPAVTFGSKSRRMWHLEAPADATRYRVFIAASNRHGVEPPFDVSYYGDSFVVGPNGRLADISDHPRLCIADLDLDELDEADPSGWQLLRDRRPDIYGGRPGDENR